MFCPNCGAECEDSAKFCMDCGCPLETVPVYCPNCGCKLEEDAVFCPECGTKVSERTAATGEPEGKADQAGAVPPPESLCKERSGGVCRFQPDGTVSAV